MPLAQNTIIITSNAVTNLRMNGAQIRKIPPDRWGQIMEHQDDEEDDHDSGIDCPRKRRRLTHLSTEEKLMRRKLKNRVAAQSARDRKKALMSDFEDRISQLEAENKILLEENASLRIRSGLLHQENGDLKKQLISSHSSGDPAFDARRVKIESECMVSAEGAHSDDVQQLASHRSLDTYDDESDYLLSLVSEINSSEETATTATLREPDTIRSSHAMVGTTATVVDANDKIATTNTRLNPSQVKPTESKRGKPHYRVVIKIPPKTGGYKTLKFSGLKRNISAQNIKPLAANRTGPHQKAISLLKNTKNSDSNTIQEHNIDEPIVLDFETGVNWNDIADLNEASDITDINDITDDNFFAEFMDDNIYDANLDSVGCAADFRNLDLVSQNNYDFTQVIPELENICTDITGSKYHVENNATDLSYKTKSNTHQNTRKQTHTPIRIIPTPETNFATVPSLTAPSSPTSPSHTLSECSYSDASSPSGSELSPEIVEDMWQETLNELFPALL